MASDAANGGGGRKGRKKKEAFSECHFRFQSVPAARLPVSVSPPYLTSHIFPRITGAHSLFPSFLCSYELWTFFSFFCQLSSSHPSSPQGPLCCLWMLLIWTPRGSLARPHSSTPWKVPLSSVSTHAQVCACAYVLHLRVCVCVCVFFIKTVHVATFDRLRPSCTHISSAKKIIIFIFSFQASLTSLPFSLCF